MILHINTKKESPEALLALAVYLETKAKTAPPVVAAISRASAISLRGDAKVAKGGR